MSRIGGLSFPICRITSRERGNRRETVFFGDDDYALYRDLLREACRREGRGMGLLPDAEPRPSDPDPSRLQTQSNY